MSITFREAAAADLDAVSGIYERIHDEIEVGRASIGWLRDVYPTRATAEAALARGDLFVEEQDAVIVGAAILNKTQVDAYFGAPWEYDVPESEIMVLHTLVIDPRCKGPTWAGNLRRITSAMPSPTAAAPCASTPTPGTPWPGASTGSWATGRSPSSP